MDLRDFSKKELRLTSFKTIKFWFKLRQVRTVGEGRRSRKDKSRKDKYFLFHSGDSPDPIFPLRIPIILENLPFSGQAGAFSEDGAYWKVLE